MRIITGIAKGTKLQTLSGDDTRPTTEVVKEGIFSAIQFDLFERKVLDLFGGCGQLALEALSRGAEKAVIIDSSRDAANIIKTNAQNTKLFSKCLVSCMDWKAYVKSVANKEKFSLVFLDPPYKDGVLDQVIKNIVDANILTDDAILVCESSITGMPEPLDGWRCKSYRYGKIYVTIFRREI
ncbi:MAG: 16S rRNA (guanine(966)-N(2))-methyltransferase RsmD [Ruminococcaceae bacterium]|nr:16S rRNA (guanine(966)-N(2))-methyltransferase RsmD [Oscillospiraceae bacterium]